MLLLSEDTAKLVIYNTMLCGGSLHSKHNIVLTAAVSIGRSAKKLANSTNIQKKNNTTPFSDADENTMFKYTVQI